MLEFIENLENEFKIKLDYNYVNKKIFHQLIICQIIKKIEKIIFTSLQKLEQIIMVL